jgi:hypothetical protein
MTKFELMLLLCDFEAYDEVDKFLRSKIDMKCGHGSIYADCSMCRCEELRKEIINET